MSLFITFEGGEGCGKSTQSKALWERLSQSGVPVELTHEPGGTALGNEIKRLLKTEITTEISSQTELLLFGASRTQLMTEVIMPNLRKGNVVICDRFADSTTVYQGYGRGIDLSTIKAVNDLATQGIRPDLIILLDIPAEQGLRRKRNKEIDRFESEDIGFHRRIRDGYLKLAAEEPGRWFMIDATMAKARISDIIWERVRQMLSTDKGANPKYG